MKREETQALELERREKMAQRLYPKRSGSSSRGGSISSSVAAAETVANIEDLLINILVRVPARPLLRFKCVSKHWLSLISNPAFCRRHTLQNPSSCEVVSAVFSQLIPNFNPIYFDNDHKPINHENRNPSGPAAGSSSSSRCNPLTNFVQKLHGNADNGAMILRSCNGLFLCKLICPITSVEYGYVYVLNPTTNQFSKIIAPTSTNQRDGLIGYFLAFDPSKSPHYKVLRIRTSNGTVFDLYLSIDIYSSETRSWRLLCSTFLRQWEIDYTRGVYLDGAIHWLGRNGELSYYHINEERTRFIDTSTPFCYDRDIKDRQFRYFMESPGGRLHLIDIYGSSRTKFDVLEMGRNYSGWFVKYHVDLNPLRTADSRFKIPFVVLFLARAKNQGEEGASLLLQHGPGTVISYNLKSKTFKSFELASKSELEFLQVNVHPNFLYMETLAWV